MKKRQMSIWMLAAVVAAALCAFAEDAYIESDGTQGIVTDYYPTPATKIVADYAYTATTPRQMVVFGCEGALVVRHYINGSGGYAFGFRNDSGDWLPVVPTGQLTATTDRRTFVLDGPNKTATLYTGGEVTATRGTATPTKTATRPLAIFSKTDQVYTLAYGTEYYAKLRLYSLAIYENDVIVHYYKPYRSADGKFTGLKDLCTGKILIDFVSFAPFAYGGDISDDPTWDLDGVEQPAYGMPTYVDDAGADLILDVPLGAWMLETPISTTKRTVKTGYGAVVLPNGNTFGDVFVVSNGFVAADYAASGLSAAHLVLAGGSNMAPGFFAPFGSSFTAPVATSGAGTVQIDGFVGFKPYNADLTVNLGGDGCALTKGTGGFMPSELDLGWSRSHTLTFDNGITLNSNTIIIKSSMMRGAKPAIFRGVLSNAVPSVVGSVNYYDGPIVFVGRDGRTDIDAVRGWNVNSGSQTISNCTIRMTKDFNVAGGTVVLKDCDKWSNDAWDYISGATGTTMVVDGGRWYSHLRFGVGKDVSGKTGNLVLTNDTQFSTASFFQNSGVVNHYSGVLAITNTAEVKENAIGRSLRIESEPNAGAGDCF